MLTGGSSSQVASLGKSIERPGQSLVDVARINVKQKVDQQRSKMHVKEKENERVH